ncbi:TadE/TadG family type IV pilus assembly protein [Pseudomonas zhanjiangensis]|uniref:TadE/TadG family type IV pilus assembly protein n=1 Tax=Pseudomonas zhanjiangensis TaxID=3239015 RepID=A0ABV3YTS1_9PSED
MKSSTFKPIRHQRGLAMVEFAIALPLLLLLLLGVAEFGRMLFQYNSLLQANRDAVRYLSGKAWNGSIGAVAITPVLEAQTKNIAVYGAPLPQAGSVVVPGLTTADVTVGTVGTDHVQVSISYVFRPVIATGLPAFVGNAIPLNFPLVATTVMRGL